MQVNISKYIEENQIISIVGPTSSGKSALALRLAEDYATSQPSAQIHLLSADSRQVYQGLEVLTGADIPATWQSRQFRQLPYQSYQHPQAQIYLHGVSIIAPNSDWSAAHFQQLYQRLREQLQAADRLLIVGGTGFYHQQLWFPAATLHVPPNPHLRQQLERLSLAELQAQLAELDPDKLAQLNHSDRHNPRRLSRAIEVAVTAPSHLASSTANTAGWPTLYLEIDPAQLAANITKRVKQRFAAAAQEVAVALQLQPPPTLAASSSTGYVELKQLLSGEIDSDSCLELWSRSELQYAKRQITWWKKRNDILKHKL